MKFGKIEYRAIQAHSLGDTMQLLAMDYIFEKAGIPADEVITINYHELADYNGEYVILPINLPLIDYIPKGLANRFSDRIIPLFLGLILYRDYLYPEEVYYLNKYTPIGCRDERTFLTLRKYGVTCYLNGCVTALFPRREQGRTKPDTVYLVDNVEGLETFIPPDIMERAVKTTHHLQQAPENPMQEVAKQYEMYKKNATLVITSLLHCAIPCMAAGIPVILAKEHFSFRFAWLERYLHVYTPEEFSRINWYPEEVNYEQVKQQLIENAVTQLKIFYDKYAAIYNISYYYESREKQAYDIDWFKGIKEKIDSIWDINTPIKYAVWGLSQITELTVSYIKQNYPNAEFVAVYDKYRMLPFEGMVSQSPEQICDNPDVFVIVCVPTAINDAREIFKKLRKHEDTYAFVAN